MTRVLLKLSGQALSDGTQLFSYNNLHRTSLEIKDLVTSGVEVGIVVGAGNIWRGRDAEENHMDRVCADEIGMLGTTMNALALENALKEVGVNVVCLSATPMPAMCQLFTRDLAVDYLSKGYCVIFAGGTGHPYFSTDTCAALRASEINAGVILMAKNGTDGVYDSDPRKNPNAVRYTTLTYKEMLDKRLGVMDLTAASICEENNISSYIFDMNKDGNITKILTDPSIGTVVKR